MTSHLHLYAVLAGTANAASARSDAEAIGIDGCKVEILPLAGGVLGALVSGHAARPARNRAHVARHAEVVGRMFATTPLLPARFGTGGDNPAAIERALGPRAPALAALLRALAGMVEVGLRVVVPDPGPGAAVDHAAAKDGRSYLRHCLEVRRSVRARREALESWIGTFEAPLQNWACRMTASRTGDPRSSSATAFLGPREGLAALREALPTGTTHPSGARVILGGPWPPWSFVDLATRAASDLTEAA